MDYREINIIADEAQSAIEDQEWVQRDISAWPHMKQEDREKRITEKKIRDRVRNDGITREKAETEHYDGVWDNIRAVGGGKHGKAI